MHVPEKWNIEDSKKAIRLIDNFGFATLVTTDLNASPLPLIYDERTNSIVGHFARNNSQSKFASGDKAVAIFNGPHHYISPSWYDKAPAVPTWNYVSVHVHGALTPLSNEQTIASLNALMKKYEPELLQRRDIVTPEIQEKLLKGIVGFSLSIDDIQAKAKLGQHRSIDDQQGVLKALTKLDTPESQSLLNIMKQLSL
ncbi:FMN-binding negative transcriptional regulator [Thalassotalea atypica]|uniref:FMN-binding negative transcriptional regulator n=1 Tax=Thalassotalea atypica TaxID=2054316 RepID=UPI00257410D5|nr:FMN-binding negative transcriptional regulator [Thalassotalea atypica]